MTCPKCGGDGTQVSEETYTCGTCHKVFREGARSRPSRKLVVSQRQERRVAAAVGGRQTPRSGAGKFEKADVVAPELRMECKTTGAQQYRLNQSDLTLLEGQSHATEQSVLVVEFQQTGRSYAVLPLEDFTHLWGKVHEKH